MATENVRLISSPGPEYLTALRSAMEGAHSVNLITAFLTAAGIQELIEPLEQTLARPRGQVRLTFAVERGGFNTERVVEELLALGRRFPGRLSLGLVTENLGILHAKALLTEAPHRKCLVIGSANLTRNALRNNHELGVMIEDPPGELLRRFQEFQNGLHARELTEAGAPSILVNLGLLRQRGTRPEPAVTSAAAAWEEIRSAIAAQVPMPPLPEESESLLRRFIDRGYLVGRGRRGTDALVLRVPLQALERRGLVVTTRRRSLGGAARESRTVGYQVELLPAEMAEGVRTESRRIAKLLSRLALNLPCFGLWMPETYWSVFCEVRARLLQSALLQPESIERAAEAQRRALLEGGGLEADVERILQTMIEHGVVESERRAEVQTFLLDELRRRLLQRTPSLMAEAIQFRTARQRWSPFEATEVPYRQLMVDIVQAVLGGTWETGDWPRRFHSFAARDLARGFGERLARAGHESDGATAQLALERAGRWEHQEMELASVVQEFRQMVPLDHEFAPPKVADLMQGQEDGDE